MILLKGVILTKDTLSVGSCSQLAGHIELRPLAPKGHHSGFGSLCLCANARVTSDMVPPSRDKFRSSKLSSSMARSATGLLSGYLTLPISKVIPWEWRIGSVASTQKPGSGSTRTVAPPSCKERSWDHKTEGVAEILMFLALGK